MHVDNAKKIYVTQVNANIPKLRFTYIKFQAKFSKTMCPELDFTRICCNTSQHTYLKGKTERLTKLASPPPGKRIDTNTSQKTF